MADTAVYFGVPGNLRRLWDPTGGILATREISSSVFRPGSGVARVSRAIDGTRQYQLNYAALGRKTWEYLNKFQLGGMGPGPFALLDPGRRNLLTTNQSTSTTQRGTTRGFTASGVGGAITAGAVTLGRDVPRALSWAFSTTTPASASLLLDKPSQYLGWPGIPVIGRPYTFWSMVTGGGTTVNYQMSIRWLDAAGATISTSNSAMFTSVLTGLWPEVWVTATAPATAVWALCLVSPDVSTITAGDSLSFSSFMFQEGSQPDADWQIGSGVYPVYPLGLPERYGFAEPGMLVSPVLTLQEAS